MSDMALLSEGERDGFCRAPADQGRELVDPNCEGLAGAKGSAPVSALLGGGVERAGRCSRQGSLDSCPVQNVDCVGLTVFRQGNIARTPGWLSVRFRITFAISAGPHGANQSKLSRRFCNWRRFMRSLLRASVASAARFMQAGSGASSEGAHAYIRRDDAAPKVQAHEQGGGMNRASNAVTTRSKRRVTRAFAAIPRTIAPAHHGSVEPS